MAGDIAATVVIVLSVATTVIAVAVCWLALMDPHYCPVCKTWHRLGKGATLTSQADGSKTLCHDDGKGGTVCHNFEGGMLGIGGKPVDRSEQLNRTRGGYKMSEELKCQECGETLDTTQPIPLQTGCRHASPTFACTKCGRLHSAGGRLMHNRAHPEAGVYLRDGAIVLLDEDGNEVDI